jgi:polyhydroxybutyrate depolymerase
MRSLTLCLFLLALAPAAYAQSGNHTISLQVGGRTRTAIVHVPPGYVAGTPVPLVLLFHGGGGNGAQAERAYGMDPISDRENFIVVYPNGTSGSSLPLLTWNAANCCAYAYENGVDDVGFVRALLDELERQYTIDPRRVYATGMSNGAMMTYRLGCELADRFAAIAPVSGSQNDPSCMPSAPLSVIAFHGKQDQHVPYYGGYGSESVYPHYDTPVSSAIALWVARDACSPTPATVTSASGNIVTDTYSGGIGGSEVVLTTIDDGGHAWPGAAGSTGDAPNREIDASELIWAFFERHPKVDASAAPVVGVESPNGGETFRRGGAVEVSCSVEPASGLASTKLLLSADGGATFPTTIATLDDPAATSYVWTIPRDVKKSKRYRVRVEVTTSGGAIAADESDGNFRIRR